MSVKEVCYGRNKQVLHEMHEQVLTCDVKNTMHYPKLKRIADAHLQKVGEHRCGYRGEVQKVTKRRNSCVIKGQTHLARAIDEAKGQPLKAKS